MYTYMVLRGLRDERRSPLRQRRCPKSHSGREDEDGNLEHAKYLNITIIEIYVIFKCLDIGIYDHFLTDNLITIA